MKQVIVIIATIALGIALAVLVTGFKTPVTEKVNASKTQIENLSVSCVYQPENLPFEIYEA